MAVGQAALAAPDAAGAALTHGAELASASAAGSAGQLHAVAAVSATDVWAVGCSGGCNGPDSLVLHWNGKKWSKVASPDPSTVSSLLFGVTAVSGTDVWAAGSEIPDASTLLSTTMVLHWNGKKWSRVHSPTVSDASTTLYGVSADSATDAWAVGNECIYPACPDPGITTDTFTMHWNGKKWSRVASPSFGGTNNVLFGVSALRPDNAWAVGDSSVTGALIVHWNGKKWSEVPAANPGSAFNDLQAVSAASAEDIWAAGDQLGASLPFDTLTEQRDGSAWTAVASPNGTTSDTGVNMLAGVAAISSRDAVAVGWAQSKGGPFYQVLILKWNGTRWVIA